MNEKTIFQIAEGLGLTIEAVSIPGHERAYRVFKGARQQHIGTEEAVRRFLGEYAEHRPDIYEGSIYGYKE